MTRTPLDFHRPIVVAAFMLLCSVALVLSGCGNRSPRPAASASTDSTPTRSNDDWFCQVGEDNEEWECVQDDALAASPKPTRLPF